MVRLALLLALAGAGHPMHTSVTEVGYEPAAGALRIAIRVYADDLAGAVADERGQGDSALARYGRARFSIAAADGSTIPLAWRGAERVADAVVLRFEGRHPGGLRGLRVGSSILHERFRDQVNVVRISEGARTTTLLFLQGDAPKTVP